MKTGHCTSAWMDSSCTTSSTVFLHVNPKPLKPKSLPQNDPMLWKKTKRIQHQNPVDLIGILEKINQMILRTLKSRILSLQKWIKLMGDQPTNWISSVTTMWCPPSRKDYLEHQEEHSITPIFIDSLIYFYHQIWLL